MNAIIKDEEILYDSIEMFEECEQFKCLLPRYASIRRFVSNYGRAYAVHGGMHSEPTFTHGLTTWLGMSTDGRDEKALKSFSEKHGKDSERALKELADFGTFGHIKTGELFTNGFVDTGYHFEREFKMYMNDCGMPLHKFDYYADLMCMYLFSMSCFAHETGFECFAVEYPVTDFQKKITTCIDLIGSMNDVKTGEKINVAINLKFRENPACYSKDIAQTNIERFMLQDLIEQGFTKMPFDRQSIDKCFILCPKRISSRTKDNYALFDTTNKYTREQYEHAHKTRLIADEKPLDVKLDTYIPQYRNTQIRIGEAPQYYTLREKMERMF